MRKISEFTDQEKKLINNFVFVMILILVVISSIKAWYIYNEFGFGYCLNEEDATTKNTTTICFNTSEERTNYLDQKKDVWSNNLDYNYINDFNHTYVVD